MNQIDSLVYVAAHQFYILDEEADWDGSYSNDPWADDGLGVADGLVGVQSPRAAGNAPVFVEIHESAPAEAFDGYSKVTEAGLEVLSGVVSIQGEENDDAQFALGVDVPEGTYRVRVLYADLDTCTYDDSDGAEHYVVQIFPGDMSEAQTLKPWDPVDDPVRTYSGRESVDDLRARLSSDVQSVRCSTLVALARAGELTAVLNAVSADSSLGVRMVAVGALRLVEAWKELEGLASSDNPFIDKAVQDALERQG